MAGRGGGKKSGITFGGGRVIIHHIGRVVGNAFDLTRKNEIEAEIATKIGLKLACPNGFTCVTRAKTPVMTEIYSDMVNSRGLQYYS